MADQIRAASVFVNGTKIGQFTDGSYEVSVGDEPNYGDNGGEVVYSTGFTMTTLEAKCYMPVAGMDYDITGALLNHTDLSMTVALVDGKIHEVTMRCLKAKFDTDQKTGKLDGSFSFGGSQPTRQ